MPPLPPYSQRTWRHYRNKVVRFDENANSLFEFGSGLGFVLEAWKHLRKGPAVGCELSPERVKIIRGKGFDCHQHDILNPLDFIDSEQFDATISCQLIEHLDDDRQENYFRESFRILKPGGEIFVESPSRSNDHGGTYVFGHINCLNPRELVRRLENVGFTDFDLSMNGPLYPEDMPKDVVDEIWKKYQPDILSQTCHVKARKPH